MADSIKRSPHRSWVGILLILIGFLFLMDTLDILNVGRVFAQWWPLILILTGFIRLKGRDKTGGALVFVAGIVFLSATLDIINWVSILRFWPLILIAVGVSVLLKTRGRSLWGIGASKESSEDFIRSNAIFGRARQTVASEEFKGGDFIALFGGIELDLRGARVSPDGCELNLTALFGGIEVFVPADWQVSVTGMPILGGIDDNTGRTQGAEDGTKVSFKCTVAFGGIEIRN